MQHKWTVYLFTFLFIFSSAITSRGQEQERAQANKIILFQDKVKKFKELRGQIENKRKEGKAVIEEENEQYLLAKEISGNIEKGKTTEQEIIDWFGEPIWTVDTKTIEQFTPMWSGYIKRGEYPAPKANQKIFGYIYDIVVYYTNGLSGLNSLKIFITINKVTGLVEEFLKLEEKMSSTDTPIE